MTTAPAFDPSAYQTPALAESARVHHEAYYEFQPVSDAFLRGDTDDAAYFAARKKYEAARAHSDDLYDAAVAEIQSKEAGGNAKSSFYDHQASMAF